MRMGNSQANPQAEDKTTTVSAPSKAQVSPAMVPEVPPEERNTNNRPRVPTPFLPRANPNARNSTFTDSSPSTGGTDNSVDAEFPKIKDRKEVKIKAPLTTERKSVIKSIKIGSVRRVDKGLQTRLHLNRKDVDTSASYQDSSKNHKKMKMEFLKNSKAQAGPPIDNSEQIIKNAIAEKNALSHLSQATSKPPAGKSMPSNFRTKSAWGLSPQSSASNNSHCIAAKNSDGLFSSSSFSDCKLKNNSGLSSPLGASSNYFAKAKNSSGLSSQSSTSSDFKATSGSGLSSPSSTSADCKAKNGSSPSSQPSASSDYNAKNESGQSSQSSTSSSCNYKQAPVRNTNSLSPQSSMNNQSGSDQVLKSVPPETPATSATAQQPAIEVPRNTTSQTFAVGIPSSADTGGKYGSEPTKEDTEPLTNVTETPATPVKEEPPHETVQPEDSAKKKTGASASLSKLINKVKKKSKVDPNVLQLREELSKLDTNLLVKCSEQLFKRDVDIVDQPSRSIEYLFNKSPRPQRSAIKPPNESQTIQINAVNKVENKEMRSNEVTKTLNAVTDANGKTAAEKTPTKVTKYVEVRRKLRQHQDMQLPQIKTPEVNLDRLDAWGKTNLGAEWQKRTMSPPHADVSDSDSLTNVQSGGDSIYDNDRHSYQPDDVDYASPCGDGFSKERGVGSPSSDQVQGRRKARIPIAILRLWHGKDDDTSTSPQAITPAKDTYFVTNAPTKCQNELGTNRAIKGSKKHQKNKTKIRS